MYMYRNHNNTNVDTIGIDARIKRARKAAYSLVGVGLHGLDGVVPDVALLEYDTYIIPTMLLVYGLEALVLDKKDKIH